MNGNLNIGTINGMTVEQILDMMVEKKIGIYPGSGSIASTVVNGEIMLGGVVTMVENNMAWRVVHIDRTKNEFVLMKEYWEENVQFNTDSSDINYSGSVIAARCETFRNSLPAAVLDKLLYKTSHGVNGQVWIPQSNWVGIGTIYITDTSGSWGNEAGAVFDYFTDSDAADGSRIFRNASGSAYAWWTSSPSSSGGVWYVNTVGNLNNNNNPTNTFGFRPFVDRVLC